MANTEAKADATMASALRVAEKYPAVAPVVERIFKRIFPTLQLENFNAGRIGDGGSTTRNWQ
jgi:hypothetical protein